MGQKWYRMYEKDHEMVGFILLGCTEYSYYGFIQKRNILFDQVGSRMNINRTNGSTPDKSQHAKSWKNGNGK